MCLSPRQTLTLTLTPLMPGGPVQGLPEGFGQIPGGQSPEGHRSRLEGDFETLRVEPPVEPHRDGSEVQPIQEPGEMSPEDLEIMRQLSEAEGSEL